MYQASTAPRFSKPKHQQKQQRQSTSPTKTSNVSRFAQARLLVLLVRQVFNGKVGHAFDRITTVQKPRYAYLNAIQSLEAARVRSAFDDLRAYGRMRRLSGLSAQISKCNIKLFLAALLDKQHRKKLRWGLNQIMVCNCRRVSAYEAMLRCIGHITSTCHRTGKVWGWRKILAWAQRSRATNIGALAVFRRGVRLLARNTRQSMCAMLVVSSNRVYENLFSVSQSQRKRFYDLENNKRQHMANQRQNLHNLKQLIDNLAHDRSVKIGQLKREKSIKINQSQTRIKSLERSIDQVHTQCNGLEKTFARNQLLVSQKQQISRISQGAEAKVHVLFNLLKYEKEEPSSASLTKIVLNKQKFGQYLNQFDEVKLSVQSFVVYRNIMQRNLICQYEGVPLESIKLSEQYLLALEQNGALKEVLNSLLSYDLLRDQGDSLLKTNNDMLEELFSTFFVYAEQEENTDRPSQVRESFSSIKSTKSLKKKSSLKNSMHSIRSIK